MNTPVPVRAWVALGSNLGDRRANLEGAVEALRAADEVEVLGVSPWIETRAEGGPPGQPDFLNGCLELATTLEPRTLLWLLQRVETQFGRERAREVRNGPRPLDLDLLLYGERGELRLASAELELPHPRMEERRFVLEPLAALAPELILPRSGQRVRERLAALVARTPGGAAQLLRCPAPAAAAAWCAEKRAAGETLGFVPTMGALHEGHLTLVRRALAENTHACVSVFVNPLQFNDPRDYERYPRDLEADARLLQGAGASMLFTGTLADFFPESPGGLPAARRDPGPAALGLEGEFRPGHFAGVATICARLFELVRPTRAYFGEKDFQQCLVVTDLARALGYPEIVPCATSRDPDGLARSSRNQLLSPAERTRALGLSRALFAARGAWRAGERRAEALEAVLRAELGRAGLAVEYAVVRDPERFATPVQGPLPRARALIAARAGAVRLIDNLDLASLDAEAGR
jgi:pantoate--beta-alanine ligase